MSAGLNPGGRCAEGKNGVSVRNRCKPGDIEFDFRRFATLELIREPPRQVWIPPGGKEAYPFATSICVVTGVLPGS
jgi:hypothetical protein